MTDDLDSIIEQVRRMRAKPAVAARDWYSVRAQAGASASQRVAELRIYDDIGWMGTSAKALADELKDLAVDRIDVHLNSPGGDAWDGIAIYNTLRDHPATVHVVVDGIAASAASVIAMAGDTVRMNRGAQLMIHDAWGLVVGNASDMTDAARMFDKLSDAMAGIYAARAGGTTTVWREAMAAESWYSAQEAVDAGLADELAGDEEKPAANARWDMAAFAFAYAGRAAAPAPAIITRPAPAAPAAPAARAAAPISAAEAARRIHAASNSNNPKEASVDAAKFREALGLSADASDDEVKAALVSAGLATQPDPDPEPDPTPDPMPEPKAKAPTRAAGTMTVDVSAWQDREERIKRLEAHAAKARRDERDQVLAQAIADGKFAPARKDHWARLWDADPEGTRDVVDGLARNVVPVAELGVAGDEAEFDDEFRQFFPPQYTKKGA